MPDAVPESVSVTDVPPEGAGPSRDAVTVTSPPPSSGAGAALSVSDVGAAGAAARRVTVTR